MKKLVIILVLAAISSCSAVAQSFSDEVHFVRNSTRLSIVARLQLDSFANTAKTHHETKITISGGVSASSKKNRHSFKRVNNVMNYLVRKHRISSERFVFNTPCFVPANTVVFRIVNDEMPSPPPFPTSKR